MLASPANSCCRCPEGAFSWCGHGPVKVLPKPRASPGKHQRPHNFAGDVTDSPAIFCGCGSLPRGGGLASAALSPCRGKAPLPLCMEMILRGARFQPHEDSALARKSVHGQCNIHSLISNFSDLGVTTSVWGLPVDPISIFRSPQLLGYWALHIGSIIILLQEPCCC